MTNQTVKRARSTEYSESVESHTCISHLKTQQPVERAKCTRQLSCQSRVYHTHDDSEGTANAGATVTIK